MAILEINITIAIFYIFYKLLLSKDTFFELKRIVLLLLTATAIIIPMTDIGGLINVRMPIDTLSDTYMTYILPNIVADSGDTGIHDPSEYIKRGLEIIYWVVVSGLTLKIVIQLFSLLSMTKKCRKEKINGIWVRVLEDDATPFSFFKWIFINPSGRRKEETDEILAHEQAHAGQWHSIDVMFIEIVTIALWYNPFTWLIKREIRNNLEFLADNKVLDKGHDTKHYQYHLLGVTYRKAAADLYNNFNVSPLKERIKMMNRKRTQSIGKAKYLLLLPLIVAIAVCTNFDVAAVNTRQLQNSDVKNTPESEGKVYNAVEVMPQFPGGEAAFTKWLSENVKYPEEAKSQGIEGVVIARFVVKADGSIGRVEVIRKVNPLLDAEAVRVLKTLPKFKPGTQNGKAVDVNFTIPLTFSLTNEGKKTINATNP